MSSDLKVLPEAFLLTRIAEDEAVAREAIGQAIFQAQTSRWATEQVLDQYGSSLIMFAIADAGGKTQVADLTAAWDGEQRAAHIARHDPARVLAECAAKRQIVVALGWHSIIRCDCTDDPRCTGWQCSLCHHRWPCESNLALRVYASVFADHPDFDPTWRPS